MAKMKNEWAARHETRPDAGEGWYLYLNGEEQGGPWPSEQDALDCAPLYDADNDQLFRFDVAATAAGHASGKSAANDGGMWEMLVGDAIREMERQAQAEAIDAADAAAMRDSD